MSYIDFIKTSRSPSFNKHFADLLQKFKKHSSSSYDSIHVDAIAAPLIIFASSFNSLMSYYVSHPEEQEEMDSNFSNFFTNHKNQYLHIHLNASCQSSSQNILIDISFKDTPLADEKCFSFDRNEKFFEYFINQRNFFQNNNFSVSIDFKINEKTITLTPSKKRNYYGSDNVELKVWTTTILAAMGFSEKHFDELITYNLYGHTNKLRDLMISMSYHGHIAKYLSVNDITPYSIIHMNNIISDLPYQSLKNKDTMHKRCEQLDFLNPELLNIFIDKISNISCEYGFIKDIDDFNAPNLQILQEALAKRYDDISQENITKLRIIRNIAAEKGIQLNYVDERASVNSVTDKKLLIFGDKVNCEVIVIDTKVLLSRFSSRKDIDVLMYIRVFFNFLKANKIFEKILLNQGKRNYSHIVTVFCEKAKFHTEENLECYSIYFEEAMNFTADQERISDDTFMTALVQAKRTLDLKEQLVEEKTTVKIKQKI